MKKLLILWGSLLLLGAAAACGFRMDAARGSATQQESALAELSSRVTHTPSRSPTPIPPTATPSPSPTSTIPPGWRITPSKTVLFEFTASPTSLVTLKAGNHAILVSQSPEDGVVLSRNQAFLVRWSLRNIGTNYWDSNYKLVFAGGMPVTERDHIKSPDTKPGKIGDFFVWATAPGKPGEYVTHWNLLNPTGELMANVFFKFTVSD